MHKCGTHLAFTVRVAALRNALIKRKVFRISSFRGATKAQLHLTNVGLRSYSVTPY